MERPYQGIDTAAKISARAAKTLRSDGITFAARYLVPNTGGTAWKALTASEAADIRGAGLAIMPIWETYAARIKEGAGAGTEDGRTARKLAAGMGIPSGTVIYFAADYNVPAADYDAVEAYLRAAQEETGAYRVGLYGHENVVEAMRGRGFSRFWQCVAWSNEFSDAAQVIQYEWQGGPNATALAGKVGFAVDLDSAETLDGMWTPEKPRTEEEDALRWAREMHILTDDMRDVTQDVVMLYRYHRIYSPEDNKTSSGLLE